MTKFRIEKILPDGAFVVWPGWAWGGCRGNRIRAIQPPTFRFKRGAAIDLSGGAGVIEGCLLCDVTPAARSEIQAAWSSHEPSMSSRKNTAITIGEEMSWS
jgi:hypothetical protein